MIVWVFVEGESDRLGLEALCSNWMTQLSGRGWGIKIIPLDDKSRYFRKIGPRAAEKLVNKSDDIVVGLPDLYPNTPYAGTEYQHNNLSELKNVQIGLVKDALSSAFNISNTEPLLKRFYATALKHDLEALLLAAHEAFQLYLKTKLNKRNWRHPVEDQNQNQPPKRIVEGICMRIRKRRYRDTRDAKAILGKVEKLDDILFSQGGQQECPVFQGMLDWVGTRVGISAY